MFETEASVRQSIAVLSGDISQIHEQMRRLNEVRSTLQGQESEMISYQDEFKQPELDSSTWYGKYANEFEEIRTSEVYEKYTDVTSSTFSTYYSQIERAQQFLSTQLELKSQQLQNRRNQLQHMQSQQV
ncbi:DUF5082 family protein [Alkalihalophilus lindianensis]|uniref:DUF5082 family protein n=1 Tax=Alkalihalophilus lindianensis TaxID=1630542 RepID=A0ABU3X5B6_9BACI|nr:DUF5082 family protein [Alkalihalophilus lindianensis]MDV2682978.1 DUF5082 family protein [Alkalihalophilus lindianensis]